MTPFLPMFLRFGMVSMGLPHEQNDVIVSGVDRSLLSTTPEGKFMVADHFV